MSSPSKNLPDAYRLHQTIDLRKNPKLVIWLNVAALAFFIIFGYLYLRLIALIRPAASLSFGSSGWFVTLVALLVSYIGVIILHELIHGLFFWIITGERPQFGFRGAYAFAGAPDWFLPRDSYLVVGLSPLVLITLIGLLLVPITPDGGLLLLGITITANASGAIGDLAVVTWLVWRYPTSILVRDQGDAIEIFQVDPS
jgi:hypothetical protein